MEASTNGKKVSKNCNYIHDDIAFSVLSKLPVRSVKRFSCIRKSWSLLLQNPNFMNMFLNNLLSKPNSLYDDSCLLLNQYLGPYTWNFYLISGDNFENKLKLDLPPQFHVGQSGICFTRILGSAINGVLCIYSVPDPRKVILWNPATKEVKVIPPSYSFDELPPNVDEVKTRLHGFGYDHIGYDYKLIQRKHYISYDDVKHDHLWEIYSLKSNLWRKLDFDMPTRYQFPDTRVYLNGVCHWWGETNNIEYLVSFNLSNETYFTTPSPLEDDRPHFDVNLVALNGFVAMISNYKDTTSFQISILGELGVGESWIRLFHVEPLSFVQCRFGAGNKEKIFFRNKYDELACFDLTTGVIQETGVKGVTTICQMVTYKKNLLPLGVIDC